MSKLQVPPVRRELVVRGRLAAKLTEGVRSKLTLASASAGFGKTTLLADWAIHSEMPVGWLSLDASDNDLNRFLGYLTKAITIANPDVEDFELNAGGVVVQPSQAESFMVGIINEVIASAPAGGKQFVLILDDYHLIEAQQIHQTIDFLLDHLPVEMHLIISTRSDPPLALSRLRVRGQLVEIRMDDLRFSHEEAEEFLKRVMGLNISAEDVSALGERTEGWVAALQLAALSMQGQDDVHGFVRAFTGSHRYVLDYLMDEVYSLQSESIQSFLLQTGILERLTADLCNAVTERRDSQNILEALEMSNLFLFSLDDTRYWYRYHHLFADLLRNRLKNTSPEQIPALHRRASHWYFTNGFVYEAIGHALATEDYDLVAELVEYTDVSVTMRGDVVTLLGWLDALPDELVRNRPRLSLTYAWAAFVTTDMEAITPRLQDAEKALGLREDISFSDQAGALAPEAKGLLGQIATLHALNAVYEGKTHHAIELAQEALAWLPNESLIARSTVNVALGDAYRDTDNIASASRVYQEAIAIADRTDSAPAAAMTLKNDLARLQVIQGRLKEAAETFRLVLRWGSRRYRPHYAVGQAYVGSGDLLREWNRLDEAENHLLAGIQQCEVGGYSRYLLFGYVALARLKYAQGEVRQASLFMQKAELFARQVGVDRDISHVMAQWARLWLKTPGNDWTAAIRWAQTCDIGLDDQPDYTYEFEYLTLARVLIAQGVRSSSDGQLQDVLSSLNRWLKAAETSGRMRSMIEILAIRAQAFQAQGEVAKAMVALENALALAEPQGYARLFLDEGASMAELLRHAASRHILPNYVGKLVAAFGDFALKRPTTDALQSTIIEPLSKREIEVLRLLAAGLSNREIAEELFIAMGTVNTHTRKIYGKLNVRSRTQAVVRAREWNLL